MLTLCATGIPPVILFLRDKTESQTFRRENPLMNDDMGYREYGIEHVSHQ